MLTKKLFALALVSALGLSVSAAQAAHGFDYRDRGYDQTARHGEFRHRHNERHFYRHHYHHRHYDRGFR